MESSTVPMSQLINETFNNISDAIDSDDINDYIEQRIGIYFNYVYFPTIAAFGITGNGMSFCVLMMTPMRKTTTCLYMASIAVLDTLTLFFGLEQFIRRHQGYDYQPWDCKLLLFLFYFTIHYDVLLLLAMTVERYVVVRFPLRAANVVTTKRTALIIISIGIFSASVNLHNIFIRTTIWDNSLKKYMCTGESDLDRFFLNKVFPWIDSILYCFIPLTSLFVLNILISLYLRRASRDQEQMTNSNSVSHGQGQRQVTVMLILVSFAFLILSAPVALVLIIQRYGWVRVTAHDKAKFNLTVTIVNNLMYTNHMVNFLLYCISGKKFRTHLRNLFCKRRSRTRRPQIDYLSNSN